MSLTEILSGSIAAEYGQQIIRFSDENQNVTAPTCGSDCSDQVECGAEGTCPRPPEEEESQKQGNKPYSAQSFAPLAGWSEPPAARL